MLEKFVIAGVCVKKVLKLDLRELIKNITKSGYKLVFQVKDFKQLYDLPLASCKISPRRIVVRINIPIKKKEDN